MDVTASAAITSAATNMVGDVSDILIAILPIAVGLFAVFFGIKLVPKLIKKFAK